MHHVGAGWRAHEPQRHERKTQSANQQARARTRFNKRNNTPSRRTGRQPSRNSQRRTGTSTYNKTRTHVLEAILAQLVAKVAAALGTAMEKPADGRRDRNVARLVTSDGRRVSRMRGSGLCGRWESSRGPGEEGSVSPTLERHPQGGKKRRKLRCKQEKCGPHRTGERYSTEGAQRVPVPEEDAEALLQTDPKEGQGGLRVRKGPCRCRNGAGGAAGDRRRHGMRKRHDPRSWWRRPSGKE